MRFIIDDKIVLSQPLDGPLAAQIAAFAKWGKEQGYARRSRYRQVLLAACFSRGGLGSKPSACVTSPPNIRLGTYDLAHVAYRYIAVMRQRLGSLWSSCATKA